MLARLIAPSSENKERAHSTMGTHRGHRSEYGMERWLVRRLSFRDPNNGDVVARETLGLKFFTEGEVLVSPRQDGSLQRDLPALTPEPAASQDVT